MICNLRRLEKFPILKSLIDVSSSDIELVQNPALRKGFLACPPPVLQLLIILADFTQKILGGLVDLVAEPAIAVHHLDIEVNVAPSGTVLNEAESQGVGTAFRNALWKGSLLKFDCVRDLFGIKVAHQQLIVQ